MSMARNIVADFRSNVMQLIQEAAAYAAQAQPDEETEANIREIRSLATALVAALQPVMRTPRPPIMTEPVLRS